MDNYRIITDSTSDLDIEMINKMDITMIPFTFIIDGKSYKSMPGKEDMEIKEFYDLLRKGKTSTTAQINSEEFISYFEPILKEGKDIIYIAFSSGLSGTYHNAVIAKKELEERYPDRRIEVFDSLCASLGEGLFVYHAVQKKNQGASMDEVLELLNTLRPKLAHWFTVEDLNHLKRGGRLSAGAALVGTMLGIKPVLHVDDEGHLVPVLKIRGRRQSLDTLYKKIEETADDISEQIVFISHADSLEDAEYLKNKIMDTYKCKEVYLNNIGPVVGAHAGQGTIALFFIADHR